MTDTITLSWAVLVDSDFAPIAHQNNVPVQGARRLDPPPAAMRASCFPPGLGTAIIDAAGDVYFTDDPKARTLTKV